MKIVNKKSEKIAKNSLLHHHLHIYIVWNQKQIFWSVFFLIMREKHHFVMPGHFNNPRIFQRKNYLSLYFFLDKVTMTQYFNLMINISLKIPKLSWFCPICNFVMPGHLSTNLGCTWSKYWLCSKNCRFPSALTYTHLIK